MKRNIKASVPASWSVASLSVLVFLGLLWFPTVALSKSNGTPKTVQWMDFNKAIQSAAKKNKYVFVDMYADWCGYCHQMEAETFSDPKVMKELAKNFISVKFDTESPALATWEKQEISQSDLTEIWGVSSLPTLLFFNGKGEMVGAYPGYADAELFLNLLTYISSGARTKGMTMEDYLSAPAP